jgi:hypothetical protein
MDTLTHDIRHATLAIELALRHFVDKKIPIVDFISKIKLQTRIIDQAVVSYEMRIRGKPSGTSRETV